MRERERKKKTQIFTIVTTGSSIQEAIQLFTYSSVNHVIVRNWQMITLSGQKLEANKQICVTKGL